jgi:hypothetical protein
MPAVYNAAASKKSPSRILYIQSLGLAAFELTLRCKNLA